MRSRPHCDTARGLLVKVSFLRDSSPVDVRDGRPFTQGESMSDPYIGQIMLASFGYAPKNWAQCIGATLPINQYQALFSLLGTTYGGNGSTTFMLPDLRSRTPYGMGGGYQLGQVGGTEN